jgi:dipeptidyl aminopeptidase/acylaminoacyl peptidase
MRGPLVNGNGPDLCIYDPEREATNRLATGANAQSALWRPDGKHIVFGSSSGRYRLSWTRSAGAGEAQVLLEGQTNLSPWCFLPDGQWLAIFGNKPETGSETWMVPLDTTDPDHPKAGDPQPFLRTQVDENLPRVSPDGRWVIYRSYESGTNEIYMRPFTDGTGGKWQISASGELYAFWSNNGHELFYEAADGRIMVPDYSVAGVSFVTGKPRLWSDRQIFCPGVANLDLAPDRKRFAVLATPEAGDGKKGSVHVIMLENALDELKRRVPVDGKRWSAGNKSSLRSGKLCSAILPSAMHGSGKETCYVAEEADGSARKTGRFGFGIAPARQVEAPVSLVRGE